MKIPKEIPIYGTTSKEYYTEANEQITFVNLIRRDYPDTYGKIITHVKNEGQLRGGQFSAIARDRAMGQVKGCSDIIIPGNPAFVCEIKSRSNKAKISDEQIDYLVAAQKCGAFACVALGHEAAIKAFNHWRELCIHIDSVLNYKKQK